MLLHADEIVRRSIANSNVFVCHLACHDCPSSTHNTTMALSLPLQNLSAVISPSGNATTPTARPPRGRHWAVHVAALVQMGGYEEGKLERPKWVGETPLSRIVQALISFKPVFSVLKHGSRRALIRFILYSSLS